MVPVRTLSKASSVKRIKNNSIRLRTRCSHVRRNGHNGLNGIFSKILRVRATLDRGNKI